MAIKVVHTKVSTIPDGDDTSLIRPSDWNADHALTGLGTMAEQNANAVAITGGTISGVTIPASNLTGTVDVPHGGTGATTLTGYVKGSGTSAMTASTTIPNTDITGLGTISTQNANNVNITGGSISGATVSGYIPTSLEGVANGVATLDSSAKVPISQIPDAVIGALNYQGTWNATTNTPTLTSSVGTKGYYYVVSVAGTTNLNGITDWQIGDWAVYNGTAWQKIDNTDSVTSVNGYTGAVVLTTTDIAEGTNQYFTTARARNSLSAGTGISYNNTSGVITNSAPDQTVSLTGAGTTTVTGTYPNFTITSSDQYVGTVTSVAATAGTGISVSGSPITTSGTLTITNTAPDQTVAIASGTGISVTGTYPNFTVTNTAPSSGGTVTSVSGTTGRITSTGGTTPVIDLASGIATPGTTGSSTLIPVITVDTYGRVTSVTTASNPQGTVTSVTGTAPVVSSGGATPAISMAKATGSVDGYLSATDWTTFNNKGSGTVTSVAALTIGTSGTDLSSTVANGTTTPVITLNVPTASATNRGALSAANWTTFNNKASVDDAYFVSFMMG